MTESKTVLSTVPRWLEWAREIQALAQTGSHYANNEYQSQRYRRLMEIAAEIISEHTGLDSTALGDIFHTQTGYATPRVDVRGAVFQDGKLLLVREVSDGGWTMPGGWADVGDVPSQAAEREVWEEAGFRVKARRVVGVYDANRFEPLDLFHAFKLVFLCDLITGEATPSLETSEVAFFGLDEIPQPLSGERTKPRFIQDAFALLQNPDLPTVFD
jgi:ADP-ribose pyrophosphatase YjhB (NUDIX family)